jgi:hypothetical protein
MVKADNTKMSEQQQDAILAMILSAVVYGLLYYFFFGDLFNLLNLNTTTKVIIMILGWMFGAGILIGTFAKQKAHQKMAYGK